METPSCQPELALAHLRNMVPILQASGNTRALHSLRLRASLRGELAKQLEFFRRPSRVMSWLGRCANATAIPTISWPAVWPASLCLSIAHLSAHHFDFLEAHWATPHQHCSLRCLAILRFCKPSCNMEVGMNSSNPIFRPRVPVARLCTFMYDPLWGIVVHMLGRGVVPALLMTERRRPGTSNCLEASDQGGGNTKLGKLLMLASFANSSSANWSAWSTRRSSTRQARRARLPLAAVL